jgi:hypothetical protein
MAHILIGLYHSLAEAEGIVHDLVEQGFARPYITLATPHASRHLGALQRRHPVWLGDRPWPPRSPWIIGRRAAAPAA